MITRVLFVDTDAGALARIKKALEQAGPFEASVFVTGAAALEHAADQPPHLAVIALNLTDIAPTELVERLRALVPGLPVLLRAPADTNRQILESISAHGVVEGGYTARTLIPLLNDALETPDRSQLQQPPRRPRIPPLESILPSVQRDTSPRSGHPDDDMSTFDEILDSIEPNLPQSADDSFHLLVESMRGQQQRPPLPKRHERLVSWAEGDSPPRPETPPSGVFEQLSAEEPPYPDLEDSGTVSDLINVTNFRREQAASPVADIPDDMILAFEELSETDEQRDLLKALSAMDQPPSREIDLDSLPDRLKAAEAAQDAPPPVPAEAQLSLADITSPPTEPAEDSQLWHSNEAAALALELTEQTLDSAAHASVLVRDGEIVASAGELALSDLAALVDMVDCARVLRDQKTRLKVVALPDQRLSYMVAAAPSVDDLVLLTIFPENMQLGVIHGQAKNIMRALEITEAAAAEAAAERAAAEAPSRAPEAKDSADFESQADDMWPDDEWDSPSEAAAAQPALPSAAETIPDVDRSALISYACAWVLHEPAGELTPDIVQALPAWLHHAAAEHGWHIEQLDVQPDYVSLVIGITAEDTPAAMAETLMEAAARRISAAQPGYGAPASIWADAYYVVAPGRVLTAPEISQFISYQRQH
ncbi:MAG: transposase [Anaerolineae bacterium]|nr:transposase [Anaerolineae bacterium]